MARGQPVKGPQSERDTTRWPEVPTAPWKLDAPELLDRLRTDAGRGLDDDEAADRLHRFGRNQLRSHAARHVAAILIDQFRSAVILLLVVAASIAFLFGERLEASAILVVILLNTAIGFLTEWRATRSMEALRRLGRVETRVEAAETHETPLERRLDALSRRLVLLVIPAGRRRPLGDERPEPDG